MVAAVHTSSAKVHNEIGAFQLPGPISKRTAIPLNKAVAGNGIPRHYDHLVAQSSKIPPQEIPNLTAATGENDLSHSSSSP
jgi:hypothetical protein